MENKYTDSDIKELVKNIKSFKAGVIDKALDRHIDECVEKMRAEKKKKWWNIFQK
jgi:hypothetical protein